MNDEEIGAIKLNSDSARGFTLKILLMLLVFIFPFIMVYLFQGYMVNLWGEPSLTSPFYLMVVGVLIVWFAVGYAIVIPRAGRRIDSRYSNNRESHA